MRFAIFLALWSLAACSDDDLAAGGPAEADVRAGVVHYYAGARGPLDQFNPENFKFARVVKVERCEALGSDYICPVTFERPHGAGQARRFAWMSQNPEGWAVNVISPMDK